MTIRVVTDSTCDLPASTVAEHGITVVPCYVNIGSDSYLDGVELTREEFYERLPSCDPPPTTSAPGIKAFAQVYERLAAEGASEIISVHISAKLSNIVNVARLATQATDVVPVTVVDSGQLTIGTGLLALEAAKAAIAGRSMADIVAQVAEKATHVHTVAFANTLEYLRRSGRLSQFQYILGSLLKIKPLLTMHNDAISMDKTRTRERAVKWLVDAVSDLGSLEELILVHTHVPEQAEALRQQARQLFPVGQSFSAVDVTPALGAHLGPGTIGFTCVTAPAA